MRRWYEPVFRHAMFPLYETVLRRRATLAHLAAYERDQWLPRERIEALQWAKLKRLVDHCWENVPYYRRRWREAGATPDDIRSMDDYARLPVLTKADIRAHAADLHARSWQRGLEYKTTGGSTGEPLRFGYTRESYERRTAVMWRGYAWAGARMGRPTLYLWGGLLGGVSRLRRIKERLFHEAFNRRMLDAFAMGDDTMHRYADAIDRFRPEVIVAYVGPIVRLARWFLETGRRPKRPHAIVTGAEALHDAQRDLVERAFGCPVYNTYGCREFMLVASECERRDGLHVNADHLVVETVAHGRGASADVVVTDLHNEGMPFMRYANGDLATPARHDCACGRGLPLLARVDGRRLDAIRTREGHFLPGEFFPHLLKDIAGITRFQVVQHSLDAIDLAIVRGKGFEDASTEHIRSEIAAVIGEGTRVDVRFVDAIATHANGKFRVTISDIDADDP